MLIVNALVVVEFPSLAVNSNGTSPKVPRGGVPENVKGLPVEVEPARQRLATRTLHIDEKRIVFNVGDKSRRQGCAERMFLEADESRNVPIAGGSLTAAMERSTRAIAVRPVESVIP